MPPNKVKHPLTGEDRDGIRVAKDLGLYVLVETVPSRRWKVYHRKTGQLLATAFPASGNWMGCGIPAEGKPGDWLSALREVAEAAR